MENPASSPMVSLLSYRVSSITRRSLVRSAAPASARVV